MSDDSPIDCLEPCERPGSCEPDDMWDALIDLCQSAADRDAVFQMRDEAEGRA